MSNFIPDFNWRVEPANEMPPNVYAYYDPIAHEIHVEESVYDRACIGVPRDRFTIAHELAHAFLLYNAPLYVARQEGKTRYYNDPEWQANELASELLAPCHEIQGMPIAKIMALYGVSKAMVKVQLNKK